MPPTMGHGIWDGGRMVFYDDIIVLNRSSLDVYEGNYISRDQYIRPDVGRLSASSRGLWPPSD
jgi:hypothetical protein